MQREKKMTTIRVEKNLITPSKIVCVGRNYIEHISELGNEPPDQMVIFLKPTTAISTELRSAHEEPVHYEGELCFLYQNKRFSAVGFGLDLTKRDLQNRLKKQGLPWERAKAFDGSVVFSQFKAISEISPRLTFELNINDRTVQNGNIDQMIYKPDQILTQITTFMTLLDGDIVMTGTPKGVGKINQGEIFTGTVRDGRETVTSETWQAK